VYRATGMAGMLVERQACCCVSCYWHGRHASGKTGMLATFCANGKANMSCFVLVVKRTCLLQCVLLVRHASSLHRSKRHGTYMGTRGEPLFDKKLCVDAISENYFINYKRKQLSDEHYGETSPQYLFNEILYEMN
jgi:hypothetical protein